MFQVSLCIKELRVQGWVEVGESWSCSLAGLWTLSPGLFCEIIPSLDMVGSDGVQVKAI